MNTYRLLRPIYRPTDGIFYRLSFEPIRLIQAPTAEDAIAIARRLGYFAPVVEPAQESLQ